MTTKNDGGPAFPFSSDVFPNHTGMSMRDYMAIHAPASELLVSRNPQAARYAWADSMLEARKK